MVHDILPDVYYTLTVDKLCPGCTHCIITLTYSDSYTFTVLAHRKAIPYHRVSMYFFHPNTGMTNDSYVVSNTSLSLIMHGIGAYIHLHGEPRR